MKNITEVARLLNSAVDAEMDAALLIEDGAKTKDVKTALLAANVPTGKVNAFCAVYRAVAQGKSLGFDVRNLPVAFARLISKGMCDGFAIGKETFQAALEPKAKVFDVLRTFDPAKAQETLEKALAAKQSKLDQEKFDAMKPQQKAYFILAKAIEQIEALGFDPAQTIDMCTKMLGAVEATEPKLRNAA
jgi:hypothetical protein